MPIRNLNPYKMFLDMARSHVPECRFTGKVPFAQWKEQTLPRVIECLGDNGVDLFDMGAGGDLWNDAAEFCVQS